MSQTVAHVRDSSVVQLVSAVFIIKVAIELKQVYITIEKIKIKLI